MNSDARKRALWCASAVALAIMAFAAEPALAQAAPPDAAPHKTIIDHFAAQARTWQAVLRSSAIWLFFALASIQFVVSNIGLVLKGASLGDLMEGNVRFLLGTGVMYAFLVHSYDWMRVIVMSFRQAGERAVLASAPGAAGNEAQLDPSFVFENGLAIAGSLFSAMSVNPLNAFANLPLVLCAILVIVCFGFLAAFMAVAIIESYIVIGGAVLLLGFGGSSWTADIAKRTLMYAVSVGSKLFVMQLVVGVAMGIIIPLANAFDPSNSTDLMALLGVVFFIVVLAKTIPDLVQGLLNGVSVSGMGAPLTTAAAIAAGVGAGAMAVGGAVKGVMLGSSGASAAASGGASGLLLSSDGLNTARMAGHLANAGGAGDVNRTAAGLGLSQRMFASGAAAGPVPAKPELPGAPSEGSAVAPPFGTIRGAGTPPPVAAAPAPIATPPSSPASGAAAAGSASSAGSATESQDSSQRASAGADTTASATGAGSSAPLSAAPGVRAAASEAGEASSPSAPKEATTPPVSTAMQRYQAAGPLATVGLVVAGPLGAVAGLAAAAAYGPQIAAGQARARAALDAAKVKFGITAPQEKI